MPRLSGRQWVSAVAGSMAASLAVVGGWSAGWNPAERVSLTALVGLLTLAGQFVLYYKINSRRKNIEPPAMIPRRMSEFRGRVNDIQLLKDRYAKGGSDRARTPGQGNGSPAVQPRGRGPILILIHGKPGVGKSAVARELANSLISDFPGGQLYANLGSGGEARTTGEILGDFLQTLGRKPKARASRRRKEFRALTASRRLLIVLDAARDAEQLRKLLPNGEGCCVIVTSRRSLGPDFGVDSYHLDIPDENDALEIVTAFSKVDWRQQPECAADILDMCGRLPLALRAIGERIASRAMSFRAMADALESERSTGLARLTYGGKSIDEDLESEYERLTDREKRAFRLLTLVGSTTFIPWVLRPLLEVDVTEAENLVAQLAEAELLEVAGPDSPLGPHSPLGVARYRFHPLARLFAQARLADEEDKSEQQAARDRLEAGYLEVIVRVLIKLDPGLANLPGFQVWPAEWLSITSTLPARIAGLPSHWVRADYKNWMQACKAAHRRGNWGLCWRICTFLSGPIPDDPDIEQCYEVFELAGIAAEHDSGACANIEVLLAKGTFLLALERYAEALETFELASVKISEVKSATGGGVSTMRLEAIRHRKLAEGWIQLGAYGRAVAGISEALSLAGLANEGIELDRARLLQADIEGRMTLDPREPAGSPEVYSVQSDFALWFRAQLMESEVARRARNWPVAESHLKNALEHSYGDVRRTANVLYRLGRLRLNQSRSASDAAERDDRAWGSVSMAAASLNTFRSMGNTIGVVRARCLLARALATAGRLADADDELQIADSELNVVTRAEEGISNPLKARLSLAQGEIWLLQKRYEEASQALSVAVTRFHEECDRWSQVEALLLRGRSERYQGRFTSANITLWAVAAAFECLGDETGVASALEQLALTAEGMGQFASAIELRLLAQNGTIKHVSPRAAIMLARSIYGNRGRRWASEAPRDRDIHLPV